MRSWQFSTFFLKLSDHLKITYEFDSDCISDILTDIRNQNQNEKFSDEEVILVNLPVTRNKLLYVTNIQGVPTTDTWKFGLLLLFLLLTIPKMK